jgi:hypothetical protein
MSEVEAMFSTEDALYSTAKIVFGSRSGKLVVRVSLKIGID